MKRGFTLFEILLALFIMSMIVVGGMQWSKRKHEEAAARQLGLRLFQYGMAVSEYARQNPDGYTSKHLPPNNLYGVDWLKHKTNPESCYPDNSHCQFFLGQDFSFNLSDLRVGPLREGVDDSQIHVELVPPTSDKIGPLTVKLISVGKVYRYTTGTSPYSVDISLDSRAVNFANQYNDQSGTAEITYTLYPLNQDGMITGVPSTTSPNIDSGYLRTDGTNQMDNSIRFSSSAATKNIENVSAVKFHNGTVTSATVVINFDKGNAIYVSPVTNQSYILGPMNSFCGLSAVVPRDNNSGTGCEIKEDANGNYLLWRTRETGGQKWPTCKMNCFLFNTP